MLDSDCSLSSPLRHPLQGYCNTARDDRKTQETQAGFPKIRGLFFRSHRHKDGSMLQSMLRPSVYKSSLRISMSRGAGETPGADQAILRAAQMRLEPCRYLQSKTPAGPCSLLIQGAFSAGSCSCRLQTGPGKVSAACPWGYTGYTRLMGCPDTLQHLQKSVAHQKWRAQDNGQ